MRSWSFSGSIPKGWTSNALGLSRSGGGTILRTTPTNFAYQLISPKIILRPGWYLTTLHGSIPRGGLELGLLDTHRVACIGNGWFWQGQRPSPSSSMSAVAHIDRRTTVNIVLANWVPVIPESSSFLVRRITIHRLPFLERPDVVDFYTSQASPLIAREGVGANVRGWGFAQGLPTGWSIENHRLMARNGGALVSTTPARFSYELVSPILPLGAGTYTVLTPGRVEKGGLALGVVDVGANHFLSQDFYWSGQRGFENAPMATSLTLKKPSRVQIVLSNWAPESFSSTWVIRAVSVHPQYTTP